MVIPLLKEKLYGRSSNQIHQVGVRGHIRQTYQDSRFDHVGWFSELYDVGRGLDKGSNSCYICDIHLFDGANKGEK